MTYLEVDAIRQRVWHSISPTTAAMAGEGCTVADLQQFIAYHYEMSDAQLRRLANHLGVKL